MAGSYLAATVEARRVAREQAEKLIRQTDLNNQLLDAARFPYHDDIRRLLSEGADWQIMGETLERVFEFKGDGTGFNQYWIPKDSQSEVNFGINKARHQHQIVDILVELKKIDDAKEAELRAAIGPRPAEVASLPEASLPGSMGDHVSIPATQPSASLDALKEPIPAYALRRAATDSHISAIASQDHGSVAAESSSVRSSQSKPLAPLPSPASSAEEFMRSAVLAAARGTSPASVRLTTTVMKNVTSPDEFYGITPWQPTPPSEEFSAVTGKKRGRERGMTVTDAAAVPAYAADATGHVLTNHDDATTGAAKKTRVDEVTGSPARMPKRAISLATGSPSRPEGQVASAISSKLSNRGLPGFEALKAPRAMHISAETRGILAKGASQSTYAHLFEPRSAAPAPLITRGVITRSGPLLAAPIFALPRTAAAETAAKSDESAAKANS